MLLVLGQIVHSAAPHRYLAAADDVHGALEADELVPARQAEPSPT